MWSDPQSQQIHGQLNEIVTQQQSEENETLYLANELAMFVEKGMEKSLPKEAVCSM